MDSQFLEFWGNYLLASAKGQRQLEDLQKWIHQGFRGYGELAAMLRKFYGLQAPANQNADWKEAWQKATQDFEASFKTFSAMLDMVPNGRYQALERKCDQLQKQIAEQEETIKILRELLAEKGTYQGEAVKVFQDLANKQVAAFETLIKKVAAAGDYK